MEVPSPIFCSKHSAMSPAKYITKYLLFTNTSMAALKLRISSSSTLCSIMQPKITVRVVRLPPSGM